MATRCEIQVDASPDTVYAAARRVLAPHFEEGAFTVCDDERGVVFGISFNSSLAASRYRFAFDPAHGGTRIDAVMGLGGVLGPLHSVLRRRGNRKHLDDILADMKLIAEGTAATDRNAPTDTTS